MIELLYVVRGLIGSRCLAKRSFSCWARMPKTSTTDADGPTIRDQSLNLDFSGKALCFSVPFGFSLPSVLWDI